ncbi:MAG TPA: OsmC family protein [Candidatus Izemoplasmatales bacterium]|nr:OsmC family protein [Bacillota bacterium]HRY77771.1 OsmC family protein [Candidatus Izemoplasmatales bacterium]
MATEPVKMRFTSGFDGEMTVEAGTFHIGEQGKGLQPYNLLLGALGSCFYATFLDIVEKKRLKFDGATLDITGQKRTEVPSTLETVHIQMRIVNPSDEKQFLRSVELGAKYCSIHETVAKVATITIDVEFVHS